MQTCNSQTKAVFPQPIHKQTPSPFSVILSYLKYLHIHIHDFYWFCNVIMGSWIGKEHFYGWHSLSLSVSLIFELSFTVAQSNEANKVTIWEFGAKSIRYLFINKWKSDLIQFGAKCEIVISKFIMLSWTWRRFRPLFSNPFIKIKNSNEMRWLELSYLYCPISGNESNILYNKHVQMNAEVTTQ